LDIVFEGSHNDNLANVIMEALTIGRGLPRNHIAQKLLCFGRNGVNIFQGTKNGLQNIFMTPMPLILLGPLYGPLH